MPGFLSPRKGVPLPLIPEYSGINKGQRVPDRSKTAHRKPLVKCFLTDKEQWTGSKLGKKYVKAAYCHPAYLTYVQTISCEMLGWMKHKLESRLLGEISITSDIQKTPPYWHKAKRE